MVVPGGSEERAVLLRFVRRQGYTHGTCVNREAKWKFFKAADGFVELVHAEWVMSDVFLERTKHEI